MVMEVESKRQFVYIFWKKKESDKISPGDCFLLQTNFTLLLITTSSLLTIAIVHDLEILDGCLRDAAVEVEHE